MKKEPKIDWMINWSSKWENGGYSFKGTEAEVLKEVATVKDRFKSMGKRPKVTHMTSEAYSNQGSPYDWN